MSTGQLLFSLFFVLMVQGQNYYWTNTRENDRAIGLTHLIVEDPNGSGNYVLEDLTGQPNQTIPFKPEYIKYVFYSREYDGLQFNKYNLSHLNIDTNKETVFVIHGWRNTYESPMAKVVKDAYLDTRDVNVIVVDWSKFCGGDYITAKFSVTNVGRMIAEAIWDIVVNHGLNLETTGIVGHSLGAHVGGVAGRNLEGDLSHIIALDPAGPLFYLSSTDHKLDKSDAQFVEVIHSCSGILGYPFSLGHADYWPNGGFPVQPGCGLDVTGSCSHAMSYIYYSKSLASGGFLAVNCEHYFLYIIGLCNNYQRAVMGNGAADKSVGNFFLSIVAEVPTVY